MGGVTDVPWQVNADPDDSRFFFQDKTVLEFLGRIVALTVYLMTYSEKSGILKKEYQLSCLNCEKNCLHILAATVREMNMAGSSTLKKTYSHQIILLVSMLSAKNFMTISNVFLKKTFKFF